VAQKLGAALFAQLGTQSPLAADSFLDAFPVSLLTTSTLARLRELRPQSRFEARRFRMNVIVESERVGFLENEWVGRAVKLGDPARLQVTMLDLRCVMTTLAQGDLPRDHEILRTLVHHNRVPVGGLGTLPCAGAYAVVTETGTVKLGDAVLVA
jgi:uncharacterized protein YcbX